MANFFKDLDDVGARVRSDPINGKAMLGVELAMGVYSEASKDLAERWIAMDDARLAQEERQRKESWQHELQLRTIAAAETQASEAIKATRVSWFALGVSIVGLVIAAFALLK